MSIDDILKNLPELKAGKGLWQNAFHEFDVYDHSLEFVRYIRDLTGCVDLIAAGYLHDIGKPLTATPLLDGDGNPAEREPGKPYHDFDDHEIVGEQMVRAMDPVFFAKNGIDQEKVACLVGAHYLPMKGIKEMRTATNYADFVEAYQRLEQALENAPVPKEEVLTMFLADRLAQGRFCTDRDELFAIRDTLLGKGKTLKELYELQKRLYCDKE